FASGTAFLGHEGALSRRSSRRAEPALVVPKKGSQRTHARGRFPRIPVGLPCPHAPHSSFPRFVWLLRSRSPAVVTTSRVAEVTGPAPRPTARKTRPVSLATRWVTVIPATAIPATAIPATAIPATAIPATAIPVTATA